MSTNIEDLRNIGIIAHIDAGKTTATERMLYYTGAKHRMGEVDKGTAETDFDPEEQTRGITIYGACVTFNWKDKRSGQEKRINLIDTPGHVDFTAEVQRALRVLDGAVVIFSAREGVEAQSETVWRQADYYHVPRICFINKMDREGADFYGTFEQIEKRLGANPVAIQIPVGAGPEHVEDPFRGVIDLISMEMLVFNEEDEGKTIRREAIPQDCREQAEEWQHKMLEQLVDFSDALTELLLEEADVPEEMIHQVIREATLVNNIQPVLCGSALHHIGVQPILNSVVAYLPSPKDRGAVHGMAPQLKPSKRGKQPEEPKPTTREAEPEAPFCGLVFKIVADKHGDLYYVRVYSGELKANSRVLNPRSGEKENVSQLWHIQADHRKQVPSVTAGDIVGIVGLKHSVTGDTLCDPKHPVLLESITFPETVISMAIEPETSAERKKLANVLEQLKRQDPTFKADTNEETGQTLISGMGELHLDIIKNRLLRDFNLNVRVHKPRVSYRETIEKAVTVVGECHRQIAGQHHSAEVSLRLEPYEPEESKESISVEDRLDEDLPAEDAAIVMEAVHEQSQGGGVIGGFPLMNLKLTALKVDYPAEEGTHEMALRMAVADAFNKGLNQGEPVLLEPIMKLEVNVPEAHVGDIVGDLQQRRAIITATHHRGRVTVIEAEVPLEKMFGYSDAMRSLSQGLATCSMEPLKYAAAPSELRNQFM